MSPSLERRRANDDRVTAPSSATPVLATRPADRPLLLALRDIKLAHSVFALPFALLAACLAAPVIGPPQGEPWTAGQAARALGPIDGPIDWSRFAGQLALIVLCMVAARTWAMLVNRLADRGFDADNPRTARRAIASGHLSARRGFVYALAAAAIFVLGAGAFWPLFGNPWPTILALPVLAWIALYSYTKRFTALCHLFLGGALAVSPLAAMIALRPQLLFVWPPTPTGLSAFALAGFVALWVAGFDIAYALQDLAFDRQRSLRSIPAALGPKRAIRTARLLHALALVLLILAGLPDPRLSVGFFTASGVVGLLLVYEHVVLHRRGVAGLPMAFFTLNGIISLLLGVVGAADVFL